MGRFYKNSLKIALISSLLGIVLILVGVVGGGAGLFKQMIKNGDFSFGDDDFHWVDFSFLDDDWEDDWDDEDYEDTETQGIYSLSEYQIENLDIQIGASSCEILYDKGQAAYSISVKPGQGNEDIQYGVKDNTFYVKCSTDISILSGKTKPNKIVITIPEKKVYDKVRLSLGAGSVEVEPELQAKEMEIEIGAGNIEADRVVTENQLNCEVGAGNLEIDGIKAGSLKAECDAGRLVFDSLQVSGDVDIRCNAGKVELELEEAKKSFNYDLSCALGQISIDEEEHAGIDFSQKMDNKADRTCKVDCNVGSVSIDFN